jgi:hypothetical protein
MFGRGMHGQAIGSHAGAPRRSGRIIRFPHERAAARERPASQLTAEEQALLASLAHSWTPRAGLAWALWGIGGMAGAHRFYLGPWWLGAAMLVANATLLVVTGGLWLVAAGLWWLGEAWWIPERLALSQERAQRLALTAVLASRRPASRAPVIHLFPRRHARRVGR